MALHIASERVDRLARELASVTGERLTTAVERALEQRLERVHAAATIRNGPSVWPGCGRRCSPGARWAGVDGSAAPTKQEYDELWESVRPGDGRR